MINTSNYSKIQHNGKIKNKNGCNQHIKRLQYENNENLKVIIPEDLVNETLTYIGKTLEEFLSEFEKFSFKYTITRFRNKRLSFRGDKYENWITFEILVPEEYQKYKSRYSYYSFCVIRHFYYYQQVLKKYFETRNNSDTELEILVKLAIACNPIGPNSLSYGLFKNITTTKNFIDKIVDSNNSGDYSFSIIEYASPEDIKKLFNYNSMYDVILKCKKENNLYIIDDTLKIKR
jgi:hypothetical protein